MIPNLAIKVFQSMALTGLIPIDFIGGEIDLYELLYVNQNYSAVTGYIDEKLSNYFGEEYTELLPEWPDIDGHMRELMTFQIPGFDKFVNLFNASVNQEDFWINMGFLPGQLISLDSWVEDAAGFILQPGMLGSEFLDSIMGLLSTPFLVFETVAEIVAMIGPVLGKYNEIASQYNEFRASVILALRNGSDDLKEFFSVIIDRTTDAMGTQLISRLVGDYGEKMVTDYISYLVQAGHWNVTGDYLSNPFDIDLNEAWVSLNLEGKELLLDEFIFGKVMSKLDKVIDAIESNAPELDLIPEEFISRFPDTEFSAVGLAQSKYDYINRKIAAMLVTGTPIGYWLVSLVLGQDWEQPKAVEPEFSVRAMYAARYYEGRFPGEDYDFKHLPDTSEDEEEYRLYDSSSFTSPSGGTGGPGGYYTPP
jgi:hypothetical protein